MGILGSLPNMDKIQAALDEDFAELKEKLDQLINEVRLVQQAVREQKGNQQ